MQTWYLVDDGKTMPRWSVIKETDAGERVWIDGKARELPFDKGKPLAHVTVDSMHATMHVVPDWVAELERSFAYERLLDPWSDQGWIAPDGKFWGCGFYEHDDIAYALIRKPTKLLEREGWIRVHADSFQVGDFARRLTKRQQATLIALGFHDPEPGGMRGRTFSVDRSSPPPRYSVIPPAGAVPSPQTPAVPQQDAAAALSRLEAALRANPAIASLFSVEPERITDGGAGTWRWMLRWDGVDFGGEDSLEELQASDGLHLSATSWDTVEVSAWPFAEIRVEPAAERIITRALGIENLPTEGPSLQEPPTAPGPR